LDDSKIWESFKKGDKDALSAIYHQHIDLLFSYGMKLCRDDELVKDTIQDLFFDLMRTRLNLGSTDNIRFYLTKALRRRLIQNLNKHKKHFNIAGESEVETEVVFSVEEDLITREDLSIKERLIRKGLKELSPTQREILFYRFSCNFDYNEICNIMSLKYDIARQQVSRALKAVKDKIK
jgi:RNA polymerase sigma factor (sigma-70 family)